RSVPTRSSAGSRNPRGSACPAARVPGGSGSTTGPPWTSGRCAIRATGTGCWPAARSATRRRFPTTSATGRPEPICPSWCAWLEADGPSRNVSRQPRTKPGLITTKCVAIPPGTGISRCPWQQRRSWSSPGTPRKRGLTRSPHEPDSPDIQRNPTVIQPHHQPPPTHHRPRPALVPLAKKKPNPSPRQPLQAPTSQPVVAVLELLTHSVWESSPGDEAAGEREEPVVDVGA